MRHRVLSVGGALCLAAISFLPFTSAVARQPAATSIVRQTAEVAEVLREGRQLEIERRWAEALSHYEDALRQFPGQQSLQERLGIARAHYDLGRRYADRSFREMVSQLSTEGALDLYSRVLLKIQTHYVEVPNWEELVRRGTANLGIALAEPAFVEPNLPQHYRLAIDEFRGELRNVLGRWSINTRSEARSAAAAAAELARQRLKIAPTAVVLEYLCGAANTLDLYSAYLTPNQLDEVYSQIEGNFVGLGIELKAEGNALLIVRVIPDSPAEQSGILCGDRIVSVDGRSTKNLTTDEAANMLQGEADTLVTLSVVTASQPLRRLSIRRRRVEVPSVDGVEILDRDRGIGYLKLVCFQKTTCRDLEDALWKLHRQGMRRLIIDLRGNPGGLLVTAVEVVDKFVDRGIIVSTRGRSSQEDFTYSAHVPGTWRVPLVVLIDENSASAAEIFAGAIRDHRRGTIVGQRSYGKGSVQGIFPMELSRSGLRLTTAKFYAPSGRPYSRLGVEPEVVVRLAARPIDGTIALPTGGGDDPMLAAAVQAARELGRTRQASNFR